MAAEKKSARIIEGLAIILLMQCLGTFLSNYFKLILPGNLTGLLLLFVGMFFKLIRLEMVEPAARLLLDNMMLLFVPLNVGLITILPKLKEEWLAIIMSVLISTILVMVVSAKAVEYTERGRKHVKRPS